MNNMTEKLVKDGRKGRRTQMHLTITLIGTFLMVLGLFCFFVKANSVEYIDAEGILHENFYLIPIGFLFIIVGGMTSLISAITYLRFRKEYK